MSPTLLFDNLGNSPLRHVIFPRQVADRTFAVCLVPSATFSGDMFASYLPDLLFSESRPSAAFPMRNSSFFAHIFMIVLRSSQEKMRRVYAGRIIAFMKNPHAFWYRPEMNHPRSSMGPESQPRNRSPISTNRFASNPKPASFSFFDLRPEDFFERLFHMVIIHNPKRA